jgi:phenylacetate-CoA ligase
MNLEAVYGHLPITLQSLACSLEGWRLNRRRYNEEYRAISQSICERSAQTADVLEDLQKTRLRDHLYAGTHCPFWKIQFDRHAIDVDGVNSWEELYKLPILTKAEVQAESSRIRNQAFGVQDLISCHTSGTTGAGLVFWELAAAEKERWAVWWRYRQWHGISQDMWCGYFGGRSVVPLHQSEPPYWRLNYPGRQILFSGYHLSPATAEEYLSALDRYSPPWLHGYPSLLSLLASYLIERGKPLKNPPRIVTTGAENLLPQQRDLMVKAFGCPVRQHYGQAESVANISECPNGHLHIDEDFSFVELFPLDSHPGVFRVIGTNWSNPAFPLFRYDTGDLVRCSGEASSCSMTGRMVDSIDGRKEDYVVLPNGARLGRLDHIFKDLTRIREAQIYQPEREMIIFKIVKGEGYGPEMERRLLDEAHKRLGREVAIKLEYVSSLERSRTGKLRFVVSEVA